MRSLASRRRRPGFTLIEVLLVLAILVIIGGFAVTNYMAAQQQARIDQAKSQVELFMNAAKFFQQIWGEYPPTLDTLTQPAERPDGRFLGDSWIEGGIPWDPWNRPYNYAPPGERFPNKPAIWSNGPDGAPDTNDDIGNW